MLHPSARLIVALDFHRLKPALEIARELADVPCMFKIGSQLFTAEGPEAVRKVARTGFRIFLDLKFHDIPNTVAGAVRAAAQLPGVRLMNMHALGGAEMMAAAARALRGGRGSRPKLLAVTILTSVDSRGMRSIGLSSLPQTQAVRLARLAQRAGADGAVTSAHEARAIRRACGRDFLILVPGVRPGGGLRWRDDQARIATPREAIRAGADYIVVGRPITAAKNPRAAAEAILEEIAEARRSAI